MRIIVHGKQNGASNEIKIVMLIAQKDNGHCFSKMQDISSTYKHLDQTMDTVKTLLSEQKTALLSPGGKPSCSSGMFPAMVPFQGNIQLQMTYKDLLDVCVCGDTHTHRETYGTSSRSWTEKGVSYSHIGKHNVTYIRRCFPEECKHSYTSQCALWSLWPSRTWHMVEDLLYHSAFALPLPPSQLRFFILFFPIYSMCLTFLMRLDLSEKQTGQTGKEEGQGRRARKELGKETPLWGPDNLLPTDPQCYKACRVLSFSNRNSSICATVKPLRAYAYSLLYRSSYLVFCQAYKIEAANVHSYRQE